MTVLLPTDTFEVYLPTGQVDAHGWVDATPHRYMGSETGNIQRDTTPGTDHQATGRDHGTAAPHVNATATGYFQPDTAAAPGGEVHTDTGERWTVRSTVPVRDPAGVGITCVVVALAQGGAS